MAYISRALREKVSQRAKGYCEYCHTPEDIVMDMEVDHIKPESDGGNSDLNNLCLACVSCNSYKHDYQTGLDPQTNEEIPLFNPQIDLWQEHFQWDECFEEMIGLSSKGRATISRLKMNREKVIAARKKWVKAGWQPPQT